MSEGMFKSLKTDSGSLFVGGIEFDRVRRNVAPYVEREGGVAYVIESLKAS